MGPLFSKSLMPIIRCIESPLKTASWNTTSVNPHLCMSLEDSELVSLSRWLMLQSELARSTVLAKHVFRGCQFERRSGAMVLAMGRQCPLSNVDSLQAGTAGPFWGIH